MSGLEQAAVERSAAKWIGEQFARKVREFSAAHGGVTLVELKVKCPICGKRHTIKVQP